MINWLIDNTFVTVGDTVFKQIIGIPMGTDCAPYLANLFLFAYEFDFLNAILKEKDFTTLHKFKKCHRYIDDLLAVNNDGELEKFKERIYPPELKLTTEDKSNQEVTYLDLQLKIEKSTINYKLYDKRDNFGFSIVNFPDLRGNIPTAMEFLFLNLSDILDVVRTFRERTSILVDRLKKQGFRYVKLCQTFTKFAKKYPYLLKKYRNFTHYDLDLLLLSGDGEKHLPNSLKGFALILNNNN